MKARTALDRSRHLPVLVLLLVLAGMSSAACAATAAAAEGRHHDGVGASCDGAGCHPSMAPHVRAPDRAAGPGQGAEELPEAARPGCLDCHDLAAGDSKARLRGGGESVCLECHARVIEPPRPRRMPRREQQEPEQAPEPHAHGPVANGRCAGCHRMHGQREPGLLRGRYPAAGYSRYSAAAYSACLGACHPASLIEETRTSSATAFRNGDDNLHFRHVVRGDRGQSCRLCHVPHVALGRGLVADSMPYGTQKLTLDWRSKKNGGRCATTCHMPLAYDREEAIPSPLRVRERRENGDL